ncbi:MAG: BatD family protein, partial [Bacteroidota bacterium]
MRTLTVLMMIISLGSMQAQNASFSVTVSSDSILAGNQIIVTFSLENAQGTDFYFPEFNDGLIKVSGPNMSSQISIINGQTSQSTSYTFYLQADEVGDFYVEPASVKVGDNYLETNPLLLKVVPNPEGIIQPPNRPGNSPFGGSLFGNDLWNDDFFNRDLQSDDFFRDFFNSPFDQLTPEQLDSLRQQQPAPSPQQPK